MTATLNLSNLSANVDPSTLTAVSVEDAVILAAAYKFVVDNFAATTAEVAEALSLDTKTAKRYLERLGSDLVVGEHINGRSGELTWQSYFDVENEEDVEARSDQAFIDTFRISSGKAPKPSAAAGATGPRYTPEQLATGREARLAGASWPKVAEAAGVKSDGYFSRVLRATFADLA